MPRRPAKARRAAPKTIDDYLAPLSADQREALERLRRIVRRAYPRAEECISYQMPAFKIDGRMLVWFGASTNHCALFPGGVVEAFKKELKDFDTSKGTVRFQPPRPIPVVLVRKLIAARVARQAGR